ncbi:MAG: HAMP domain-containing histidine kinase [Oscillospiraceae bacterium]|nr:HAMP domain-containing histidine kinase [Oscillospiraceae bacterium]
MKFSWKMILLVTLLLAFSLSLGGYMVVQVTFDTQIENEIAAAQEDMRLFSMLLRAVCSNWQYSEVGYDFRSILQEQLQSSSTLSAYEFCILDADGTVIVRTDKMRAPVQAAPTENYVLQSRIVDLEGELIVTTYRVELGGQSLCIQRERDVSTVFHQAEENLGVYQWIMLAILAVSVALTTVFIMIFTQPLSRISRTARQLSAGHYEKRVNVRSNDELGQVARDFNAMADALEAKISELDSALERQKEFTASFAHELKTPLTSVIGYADTLRSRALPPERQFEAADYIVSEGKRLQSMSFALLDLFSLEREAPRFRNASVTQLMADVSRSCAWVLREKQLRLEVRAEEAQVSMVPELMQTLLYNLIDNARKASAPGSVIRLTGAVTDMGYSFSVRDFGRGIPAEELSRITEPFYMVDKSRARAEGGAGLGLALCNRIARLHGAQLRFYSEVGKGTEVTFQLGGAAE